MVCATKAFHCVQQRPTSGAARWRAQLKTGVSRENREGCHVWASACCLLADESDKDAPSRNTKSMESDELFSPGRELIPLCLYACFPVTDILYL